MKRCFKCNKLMPISRFYIHPRMADRHLNKCKICTRLDTANRIELKKLDPLWVQKERARCREKQKRYHKLGLAVTCPHSAKKWRQTNPQKYYAQIKADNALRSGKLTRRSICEYCGQPHSRLEKHHPDYSEPLLVQWLCPPCHGLTRRKVK